MNRRPRGWPSPVWWATLGAAVMSVLLMTLAVWLEYERSWSVLEKFYLRMYAKSWMADLNPLPHRAKVRYRLVDCVNKKGEQRLALPGEVDLGVGTDGKPAFVLTEQGQQDGLVRLVWGDHDLEPKYLRALLGHWIYQDQGVWGYVQRSVYYSAAFFAVFLFLTVPKDRARTRVLREGRKLQGPELVTVEEFNSRNQSDGVGFWVESRSLRERLFRRRRVSVHIPRNREAHHLMFMGDTGAGKSSRIREVLIEVERRDEGAIVHDPALEYTPEFYRPERGDIILNPLDQRMPYWSPADEVQHEAEAATIAASLFPDPARASNDFFVKGPRRIFARLLQLKLPPHELARVMSDERELDRITRGTDLETLLYHGAGPQRGGVMGELSMVVDGLKLLPRREETSAVWTATEWAKRRKGWLFITSTPETREALLPLISLWLDTLALRLMSRSQQGARPVWFVLDELDTLKRLPQLHDAITQTRKSGNPVVLGFQGRSQMEARYGDVAEAMLSQPSTKIFMRTGEPRAARWVSEYIGDVEKEFLRVSYSEAQSPNERRSKTWHTETPPARPLVIASTIQGLADQHGYLKHGNLLVKAKFSYISLPKKQPGFLLRKARAATAAAASSTSREEQPHFD